MLSDLLQRYLEAERPTSSLVTMFRLSWPKFLKFCHHQGFLRVDEITPAVLEDFHKSLLWAPNEKGQWYKANSVDQYVRRVRQVLRWCFLQGILDKDPTVGLLLPRPVQPTPARLNWEQLQTLLSAPDRVTPLGLRDALLVQLLAEADLPLLEVMALTETTVRELDLAATTWTLLAEYLERGRPQLARVESETALFLGRLGEPLGSQAATVRLNELVKQAGLGKRLPTRVLRQSYQAALQTLRARQPIPGIRDDR